MHRQPAPMLQVMVLQDLARDARREIQVIFSGENGEENFIVFDAPDSLTVEGKSLAIEVTKIIIAQEMSEAWSEGLGASGTLRFSIGKDEPPWLDADSAREDWSYERFIDTDELAEVEWPRAKAEVSMSL